MSAPMGTLDIDSIPPATTKCSNPDFILVAARLTASRPDPQQRFICIPGTSTFHPAYCAAVFPMFAPCSLTGITQPMITSSILEVSKSFLLDS